MTEQGDLFAPGVAEASAARVLTPAGEVRERFDAFGVGALDEGDTLALILESLWGIPSRLIEQPDPDRLAIGLAG